MVKEHLLNPKEFWGKYVIPTIARDDLAFADQFYWRGDIWGPTNYMVYEGLNRYRFDKVALEYAEKNRLRSAAHERDRNSHGARR